uniref:Uncharacterized protein n=1 Tax=Anguilla anguilla TaxID=7936 RepID=A0A0E9T208_ANGAN
MQRAKISKLTSCHCARATTEIGHAKLKISHSVK